MIKKFQNILDKITDKILAIDNVYFWFGVMVVGIFLLAWSYHIQGAL